MKKGNKNDEEEKGKRDLKRRRSRLTITGALGILPLADPTQRGLIAAVLWSQDVVAFRGKTLADTS